MDATADVEITGEDVMTVGSYRLGLPELATIARTARERAADPGIDGVVVTHGTDTMEETSLLVDLAHADPLVALARLDDALRKAGSVSEAEGLSRATRARRAR